MPSGLGLLKEHIVYSKLNGNSKLVQSLRISKLQFELGSTQFNDSRSIWASDKKINTFLFIMLNGVVANQNASKQLTAAQLLNRALKSITRARFAIVINAQGYRKSCDTRLSIGAESAGTTGEGRVPPITPACVSPNFPLCDASRSICAVGFPSKIQMSVLSPSILNISLNRSICVY